MRVAGDEILEETIAIEGEERTLEVEDIHHEIRIVDLL